MGQFNHVAEAVKHTESPKAFPLMQITVITNKRGIEEHNKNFFWGLKSNFWYASIDTYY